LKPNRNFKFLIFEGNIVLVDFGQAKAGLGGEDARTSTICGTPAYFAPELLKGKAYTKAVDWWSLGTMCVSLEPYYRVSCILGKFRG
jgi:serum/glucocorticoid-regulated kinase 2